MLAALSLILAVALAACENAPPTVPTTPTEGPPTATTSVRPEARATYRLYMPHVDVLSQPAVGRATAVALAPNATPTATPTPAGPTNTPRPTRTRGPTDTPGPTNTPGPTRTPRPTPTPKWPGALAEPGASKLGLHVQRNNSPDIMEFVRVAKPRVVKGVDDLHWLTEVKQASPQTVTIGRVSGAPQKIAVDPVQAARAFVADQMDEYEFNRNGVDYWEGWNEPAPKTPGDMQWYAAFEAERVRLLAERGFRAAVGTFPTGVPEWDIFAFFLPAIQAAKQNGGVLALHEYSAPTMQYGVGAGLPGRPAYPNRGVLTLRYRYWYEDYLKPRGLAIPLVLTEAGVDGGIRPRPGPQDAFGWRDFSTYWSQTGLGNDDKQVYLSQLEWFDQETRQDSYVLGFTVFTAGAYGKDWQSFDVTDILGMLAAYVVTQK